MISSLVASLCNALVALSPIALLDSLIQAICSPIISTLTSFGL